LNIVLVVVSNDKFDHNPVGELPLGPAYIASYVKKHIPDCNFSIYVGLPPVYKIFEKNPDLLGISSVTDNYTHAVKLIKTIRHSSNIPIIIGGHHISYLPHLLPREADVGVLFEGERTFLQLTKLFEKQAYFPTNQLKNVHGIVFWDGDTLIQTKQRELIKDLNSIPFPDRDSIEYFHHKKYQHHIMTSRGCPHKCKFCSSHAFWKRLRYFSATYVVNEIEYLQHKYKLEHLHIYDDLWIANKKRFFLISELIKKRNLHKKLTFHSWVTSKTLTHDVAETLASLNFDTISIGFETGSERILRYLKHRSATLNDNKIAIKIAKTYGLKVGGTFMIGIPGETLDDIYQTKMFIMNNDLDHASIYLLKPLPSTEIWDYAIQQGLVNNDMTDWGILNNDDILAPNAILLNRNLQPELLNQKRAEIQKQIYKKHIKSVLRELFSGKPDFHLLRHYLKRVIQSPGFAWSYFKGLFLTKHS